jgi:hypothetical protein
MTGARRIFVRHQPGVSGHFHEQTLSPNTGKAYAPSKISEHPDGKGYTTRVHS